MSSDKLANPAPIGLLGFGMTTILLSLHNLGLFGLDATIMAVGIFLGGIAQVIAGTIEFKRDSMFTATVFTFFGLFWITFVCIDMGIFGVAEQYSLATMFLLFLILAAVLFVGTLRGNLSLKFAFFMLVITLFALTCGAYTGWEFLTRAGGAFGLITGAAAFYIASADILNAQYQKPVLPL